MLNRSLAMTRILDLSTSYIPLMTPTWNQIQSSGLVNYIHPNVSDIGDLIKNAWINDDNTVRFIVSYQCYTFCCHWDRIIELEVMIPITKHEYASHGKLYRLKKNPVTMADLTSKLDGQGSTKLSGLALALPLLYDHDGFSATVDRFKDKITPLLDLTHSGTLDRVWIRRKRTCHDTHDLK